MLPHSNTPDKARFQLTASTTGNSNSNSTSRPSTTESPKHRKKNEWSSKYATSEEDARLRKDYSLLRRLIRGALRQTFTKNPAEEEEEVPNSMVLDLCRKHGVDWALRRYETERPGVTLSPLQFLLYNRARFPILQGFCQSFPQAAQEHDSTSTTSSTSRSTTRTLTSEEETARLDATRLLRLDGYPLHLACITRPEEGPLISLLAQQYPPAVSCPNQSGLLPLHLLLEYRGLAPSLQAVQTLIEINPETMLQTPTSTMSCSTSSQIQQQQQQQQQQPPLFTVLDAPHCSNEIKECLWQNVPAHLTCLQLDATVTPQVTLPLAKAICHVLPQLIELQWTPRHWAPPAWIYFVQKCRRLRQQPANNKIATTNTTTHNNNDMQEEEEGTTLKKLILQPPSSETTADPTVTAVPWPSRSATTTAIPAATATATALNPAHIQRALVNLLQHLVAVEHLEIRGTALSAATTTTAYATFGPGGAAPPVRRGMFDPQPPPMAAIHNNNNNLFGGNYNPNAFQQPQLQPPQHYALGFGFQQHNNNPTWQLIASQGQGQNVNNANHFNNNNNLINLNNAAAAPTRCPDITEPIVHLLTHGRLQYLRISGYSVNFDDILQALVHNVTLQHLILTDTAVEPPPVPNNNNNQDDTDNNQQQQPLTLGFVLEHYNYTLQKADVRLVVPRHSQANEPVRQAILQEYQKVKYYTLLNQFGRGTARDQSTSLETMMEILLTVQTQQQQQPGGPVAPHRIPNPNVLGGNNNHARNLVVLGILFGLLRESPGSWSQAEQLLQHDVAVEAQMAAAIVTGNNSNNSNTSTQPTRKRKDPPHFLTGPDKERKLLPPKPDEDDNAKKEEEQTKKVDIA